MKFRESSKLYCTYILLSPWFASMAQAGEVERVVVFADRAEVVRRQDASCRGSAVRVVFGGLPMSLDPRTLRAEVGAGAAAEVLGVTERVVPASDVPTEERQRLGAEIERLEARAAELQGEIQTARERGNTGAAYGRMFGPLIDEGLRDPRARPDEWRRALDFVTEARLQGEREARAKEVEARKVQENLQRLRRRRELLGGEDPGERREATVALGCKESRAVEVRLAYVLPGAKWQPDYDLRFSPSGPGKTGKGTLEVTIAAVVQQSTGEDWRDATLVLSTAKPARGARAPELAPLFVTGFEAKQEKVLVEGTEDRRSLAGAGALSGQGPTGATLEDGGKSVSFTLPSKVSVYSDGRPHWFPIDRVAGSGESKLVAVPKLRPYVYQALNTTSPAKYPLLAGRLHLYRQGSYVGDAWLEYTAPGEPIEVSLGIDEEFRVERVDTLATDRSPGFLSSTQKLDRAFEIRLENRSTRPEKVELREQLPVSKDERLKVVLDSRETTPRLQHDEVQGFLRWSVDLAAGGQAAVRLRYQVQLPDDWKLN